MKIFKDKNSLLIFASLAVILLGLISYYFSLTNPNRPDFNSSNSGFVNEL